MCERLSADGRGCLIALCLVALVVWSCACASAAGVAKRGKAQQAKLAITAIGGHELAKVQSPNEEDDSPAYLPHVRRLTTVKGVAGALPAAAALWIAVRQHQSKDWLVRGPYPASSQWVLRDVQLGSPLMPATNVAADVMCFASTKLRRSGVVADPELARFAVARSPIVTVLLSDPAPITGPCRVSISTIGGQPARRAVPVWVTRVEDVAGSVRNMPPGAYVGLAVRPLDSFDYWLMQGADPYGPSAQWWQTAYFGRDPQSFLSAGVSAWDDLDAHKEFKLIAFVTRDLRFRAEYPENRVSQEEWHKAVEEGTFLATQEVDTAREYDIGLVITQINSEIVLGAERVSAKPVEQVRIETDRPLPPGVTVALIVRARAPGEAVWSEWHLVTENRNPGTRQLVNVPLPREMGQDGDLLELLAFAVLAPPGSRLRPATYAPKSWGAKGRPASASATDGLPLVPLDRWPAFEGASRPLYVDILDPEKIP